MRVVVRRQARPCIQVLREYVEVLADYARDNPLASVEELVVHNSQLRDPFIPGVKENSPKMAKQEEDRLAELESEMDQSCGTAVRRQEYHPTPLPPDCRPLVGSILNYLANQIEETKSPTRRIGPIMTYEYWQGRQTGFEDTARFIENLFSISRMEFFP